MCGGIPPASSQRGANGYVHAMNRTRWILAALLIVMAIAMIYASSDPEMSSRYAEAVKNAQLSTEAKDLVLGGIVVAIGAYLAWFLFMRRG